MVWGAPGVGKSSIVAQITKEIGFSMKDIRCVYLEPTDLLGIPYPKDGETIWLKPRFIPNHDATEKGVLFFDDVAQALPAVMNSVSQIVLDHRAGVHDIPEGWQNYVLAANEMGQKAATYDMPSHLRSRLIEIHLEVDLDEWKDWAFQNNIRGEVIAFLNFRPTMLLNYDYVKFTKKASPRCVAPYSRVLMANGIWRPISSIEIGEWVAGSIHGSIVPAQVTKTLRRYINHAYEISGDWGSLMCSPEHYFLMPDGEYRQAQRIDLRTPIATLQKMGDGKRAQMGSKGDRISQAELLSPLSQRDSKSPEYDDVRSLWNGKTAETQTHRSIRQLSGSTTRRHCALSSWIARWRRFDLHPSEAKEGWNPLRTCYSYPEYIASTPRIHGQDHIFPSKEYVRPRSVASQICMDSLRSNHPSSTESADTILDHQEGCGCGSERMDIGEAQTPISYHNIGQVGGPLPTLSEITIPIFVFRRPLQIRERSAGQVFCDLTTTTGNYVTEGFITHNSWSIASDCLKVFGLSSEIIPETLSGSLGEGIAAEFQGFLDVYGQLPDIDRILAGEDIVPDEPSLLYAVCGAVVAEYQKRPKVHATRMLTYSNALPAEFAILLVKDAYRANQHVKVAKGFAEWATKYSNVML